MKLDLRKRDKKKLTIQYIIGDEEVDLVFVLKRVKLKEAEEYDEQVKVYNKAIEDNTVTKETFLMAFRLFCESFPDEETLDEVEVEDMTAIVKGLNELMEGEREKEEKKSPSPAST